MKYNKLVRDNIIEIIKKDGVKPFFHQANDKEYFEKLIEKLIEEAKEFSKEPNEEEMADILEVINTLCKLKGLDKNKIESTRNKKNTTRGRFNKRIILEKTEEIK